VPDCLERRIDLLRHSNSCEAAWVDIVDPHDKDGSCVQDAPTMPDLMPSLHICSGLDEPTT
jgi:hypothetical protein